MTLSSVLFLTAGLLFAAPAPQDDDLAKLQGTWITVSLVSDGKTLVAENEPPKPGPVTKLAYEGNR